MYKIGLAKWRRLKMRKERDKNKHTQKYGTQRGTYNLLQIFISI